MSYKHNFKVGEFGISVHNYYDITEGKLYRIHITPNGVLYFRDDVGDPRPISHLKPANFCNSPLWKLMNNMEEL
jgi:hypothetical protein